MEIADGINIRENDYHINYFIEPIYDRKKEKFSLKEWLKLRKFLKELKKTSPNFNMLVEIYYFIKTLSNVYFYPDSENNQDVIIYTKDKNTFKGTSNPPDYAFCVRRGSLCIMYKLWYDESWIEVTKSNDFRDSKSPAVNFKFIDGQSVISNIDEENMFLNIITITMDAVSDLVKYYWKNKFRGY